MHYKNPRASWFNDRAEDFRMRAKLNASRGDQYLKIASAYDSLAEQTEQSTEIAARFIKRPPPPKKLAELGLPNSNPQPVLS